MLFVAEIIELKGIGNTMRKKPKAPRDNQSPDKKPKSRPAKRAKNVSQESSASPATTSLENWSRLYQAAIEFKSHKTWTWMQNEDLFGVQSPLTGEIGYCCIMGALGEVYALTVYLGPEGLETYEKTLSGEFSEESHRGVDALMLQKCLMASFEDANFLHTEDLDIIAKLGLKYRGANACPVFRSYEPGYYPWYLTGNEVEFLTLALEQAVEVSLRAKKGKSFLAPQQQGRYLVRVPQQEKDGIIWSDQYLLPVRGISGGRVVPVNEVRLQRVKQNSRQIPSIWEIDRFYFSNPIRDGSERPYFPQVTLFVDPVPNKVLGFKLAKCTQSHLLGEYFLDLIEQTKSFPQQINVSKPEVFELLAPVTSQLDISLKMVMQFQALAEARDSFLQVIEERGESERRPRKPEESRPHSAKGQGGKRCGLCGKRGKLTKTPCCGNWICDDADKYVMFSYARNSCYRNHAQYTMCAVHYNEKHKAPDWRDCEECRRYCTETEMYVWSATNEYNFVKLENPPAYDPTRCSKCNKIIRLAEEGYSTQGKEYFCSRCSQTLM